MVPTELVVNACAVWCRKEAPTKTNLDDQKDVSCKSKAQTIRMSNLLRHSQVVPCVAAPRPAGKTSIFEECGLRPCLAKTIYAVISTERKLFEAGAAGLQSLVSDLPRSDWNDIDFWPMHKNGSFVMGRYRQLLARLFEDSGAIKTLNASMASELAARVAQLNVAQLLRLRCNFPRMSNLEESHPHLEAFLRSIESRLATAMTEIMLERCYIPSLHDEWKIPCSPSREDFFNYAFNKFNSSDATNLLKTFSPLEKQRLGTRLFFTIGAFILGKSDHVSICNDQGSKWIFLSSKAAKGDTPAEGLFVKYPALLATKQRPKDTPLSACLKVSSPAPGSCVPLQWNLVELPVEGEAEILEPADFMAVIGQLRGQQKFVRNKS